MSSSVSMIADNPASNSPDNTRVPAIDRTTRSRTGRYQGRGLRGRSRRIRSRMPKDRKRSFVSCHHHRWSILPVPDGPTRGLFAFSASSFVTRCDRSRFAPAPGRRSRPTRRPQRHQGGLSAASGVGRAGPPDVRPWRNVGRRSTARARHGSPLNVRSLAKLSTCRPALRAFRASYGGA